MRGLLRRFPLWPALRLALLPLLLYLLGQYLEGPAYSVIVRSVLFELASFSIVILDVQYLSEHTTCSFRTKVLPSLLLPVAFVYAMQQQFNGSAEQSPSLAVLITSLFMGLCGILYLRSLLAVRGARPNRQ